MRSGYITARGPSVCHSQLLIDLEKLTVGAIVGAYRYTADVLGPPKIATYRTHPNELTDVSDGIRLHSADVKETLVILTAKIKCEGLVRDQVRFEQFSDQELTIRPVSHACGEPYQA